MFCLNPKIMIKNRLYGFRELDPFEAVKYKIYMLKITSNQTAGLNRPSFINDDNEIVRIPCGHCLLCQAALRDEWSLRCWLEAKEYSNNQFVTLTYNDKNEPKSGVDKAEVTRFMHNVREHFRRTQNHTGIRFFGCGEYGEKTFRAHYHILLFNCPSFGDEEKYKKNKGGQTLYKSETLSHLWGKGFCTVGAVTRQSCDYVARYRLKNFYTQLPKELGRPFQSMSTQKGIGIDYLLRNIDQLIADDIIHVTGNRTAKLPRFYDRKIVEKIGQERFEKEVAIPRAERAKARLAEEMARTGLSEEEIYCRRLEQAKAKAEHWTTKTIKQGE